MPLLAFLILLCINIIYLKTIVVLSSFENLILGIYGTIVFVWLVTRLTWALKYQPCQTAVDQSELPMVTVVVPSFNEGESILKTLGSINKIDYPKNKIEIIAVDDGSTDETIKFMEAALKEIPNLKIIKFQQNRGKRQAMAAGILSITHDGLVLFVDSDTGVDANALKRSTLEFVRDKQVGVVTGHGHVANGKASVLSALQEVKYFFAFRLIKAAESHSQSVICASGCFALYRIDAVRKCLDLWQNQTFLGKKATYGDDRALTTLILNHGYKSLYRADALVYTIVPETFEKYWKQQLRWKKSWTRETLLLVKFIHRRGIKSAFNVYSSALMTVVGPSVMIYFLFAPLWQPGHLNLYLIAMYNLALIYSTLFGILSNRRNWWKGLVFALLISPLMALQIYYAFAKLTDTRWGTRDKKFTRSKFLSKFVKFKVKLLQRNTLVSLLNTRFPKFSDAILSNSAIVITATPILAYYLF